MYLPPGYKTSTKDEVVETKYGRSVKLTHHFDGSRDATVKVKAIKLSLTQGAPPDPVHVKAIKELQDATRALEFARQIGQGIESAERRLREANERILAVQ